jgi:hypothetical protein
LESIVKAETHCFIDETAAKPVNIYNNGIDPALNELPAIVFCTTTKKVAMYFLAPCIFFF